MLFCVAITAAAEERQKLFVYSETSTFTQVNELDQSGGEATRFVQGIIREGGFPFEFQYLPWRRAYNRALEDENTVIFPIARSRQREQLFKWIGRLIPVDYYLFRLKSRDDIKIDSLEDAKAYRLGVVNFHVHHQFFLSQQFENLQTVNSNYQNLRKAVLGRIDIFPMSDGGILPICERRNIDCTQFIPILKLNEISGGLYVAASKQSDDGIVRELRASYQRLVESGEHQRAFRVRLEHINSFKRQWPQLD